MKQIIRFAFIAFLMCGTVGLASCNKGTDTTLFAPTQLSVEEPRDYSAVLKWAGEAASYEVIVGDGEAVTFTGKTYTATGLEPEQAYTWRVRAKDGGNYSEWVNGPIIETTIVAPTGLDYSDVTENSAVLTWDGDADSYEISVGANHTGTSTEKTYTANGLRSASSYTWSVRSVIGNKKSNWVRGPQFNTMTLEDTHTFAGGFVDNYYDEADEGTELMRNWYIMLIESTYVVGEDGQVFPGDGYALALDLYAPATSSLTIPEGVYSVGGENFEAWTAGYEYSSLIEYSSGSQERFEQFESGTITVAKPEGGNDYEYTIRVEVVTIAGTIVVTTYDGAIPGFPTPEEE